MINIAPQFKLEVFPVVGVDAIATSAEIPQTRRAIAVMVSIGDPVHGFPFSEFGGECVTVTGMGCALPDRASDLVGFRIG